MSQREEFIKYYAEYFPESLDMVERIRALIPENVSVQHTLGYKRAILHVLELIEGAR